MRTAAVQTALLIAAVVLRRFCACSNDTGPTKNVLLIIADDMRLDLGVYGANEMKTPNLDELASRSAVMRRAYVQMAGCSPSRTSMLTGRRPDTTRVHDLVHYWRQAAGNFTTLPQYFKQNGYKTAGFGKVRVEMESSSSKRLDMYWKFFTAQTSCKTTRIRTGPVADPKILKSGGRQFISPVYIYRKCIQRTICLFHGKRRLFEKKSEPVGEGAPPPP